MGALRSTTLQALNVPLRQRVGELENALNAMRYCTASSRATRGDRQPSIREPVLYEHGNLVLNSRLIVGKPSTLPPTFPLPLQK